MSVAGGSRQRDEHILRGMKEVDQGERSNGSERVKSREGELITNDLSDIICRTNCRAAAGGNGELKV